MRPIVITFPSAGNAAHDRILEDLSADLIVVRTIEEARMFFRDATHVLLQGGRDISPHWYGEKPGRNTQAPDEIRDKVEMALAVTAIKYKKPLMGVCRGHQMVAVACGGKLTQHIVSFFGMQHKDGRHLVHFTSGTKLERVYGSVATVNSFHHQAVKFAPKGLGVAARSNDDIIEALEGKNVITVQWHPEIAPTNESYELYMRFLEMNQPKKGGKKKVAAAQKQVTAPE